MTWAGANITVKFKLPNGPNVCWSRLKCLRQKAAIAFQSAASDKDHCTEGKASAMAWELDRSIKLPGEWKLSEKATGYKICTKTNNRRSRGRGDFRSEDSDLVEVLHFLRTFLKNHVLLDLLVIGSDNHRTVFNDISIIGVRNHFNIGHCAFDVPFKRA